MRIRYHAKFKKQYKKLPVQLQRQFDDRLRLFMNSPIDPALRIHPLKGRYAGYWSMDVTGDLRALYYIENGEVFVFALIGTHSQLYG